ncbi:hypothetical protein Pcinc_012230 [Petrolisthes cinctipes]|uniref:Uncharacterized protein n=1 Tax=Petrolisthes cinctipes TaxID=88211 RepID=A0AAE1FZH5_PETCI|nr:hypothetical protein Pcinc_012230 [Petrolisthes cinctipes]
MDEGWKMITRGRGHRHNNQREPATTSTSLGNTAGRHYSPGTGSNTAAPPPHNQWREARGRREVDSFGQDRSHHSYQHPRDYNSPRGNMEASQVGSFPRPPHTHHHPRHHYGMNQGGCIGGGGTERRD